MRVDSFLCVFFFLLYLVLLLLFGCSFCCLEDMHKNALHFRFSWLRCCCCCDFLFGCKLLLPVASGIALLCSALLYAARRCAVLRASESWFYALSKVSLHILRLLCPNNNSSSNYNCNSDYDYVKQSTAICCRAIAKLCSSAPHCHSTPHSTAFAFAFAPCSIPLPLFKLFSPSIFLVRARRLSVQLSDKQTESGGRTDRQTDRHLGIWNNLMFFIFIKFASW